MTYYFSLHYQYIVNKTGDENKENHQQGDIIQWYNTKFCELTFINKKEMCGSKSGELTFRSWVGVKLGNP